LSSRSRPFANVVNHNKCWCFRAVPGPSVWDFDELRLFHVVLVDFKRFPPWRQQTGSGFRVPGVPNGENRLGQSYTLSNHRKSRPTHGEPLRKTTSGLLAPWRILSRIDCSAVAPSSQNTASKHVQIAGRHSLQLSERRIKLCPLGEVNLVSKPCRMNLVDEHIGGHPFRGWCGLFELCAPFCSSTHRFLDMGDYIFTMHFRWGNFAPKIEPPCHYVIPGWKCYGALTVAINSHVLTKYLKIWSAGERNKMMTNNQTNRTKHINDNPTRGLTPMHASGGT